MPSNHLILCHPLLLLSIFPSIRVFSSESLLHIKWLKYWSFSFTISPSNEYSGWFPLGLTALISLLSKELSRVFFSTTVQKYQFFRAQPSLRSNSHICTWLLKKSYILTIWTFVDLSSYGLHIWPTGKQSSIFFTTNSRSAHQSPCSPMSTFCINRINLNHSFFSCNSSDMSQMTNPESLKTPRNSCQILPEASLTWFKVGESSLLSSPRGSKIHQQLCPNKSVSLTFSTLHKFIAIF